MNHKLTIGSAKGTAKCLLTIILFVLPAMPLWAQVANGSLNFWDDPFSHPLMPLIVVAALVIITIILVMVVVVYMLRVLKIMVQQVEKERADKLGIIYAPQPSWWEKMWQNLNASVPVNQEQDIDLAKIRIRMMRNLLDEAERHLQSQ